jgi:hypothetical protein
VRHRALVLVNASRGSRPSFAGGGKRRTSLGLANRNPGGVADLAARSLSVLRAGRAVCLSSSMLRLSGGVRMAGKRLGETGKSGSGSGESMRADFAHCPNAGERALESALPRPLIEIRVASPTWPLAPCRCCGRKRQSRLQTLVRWGRKEANLARTRHRVPPARLGNYEDKGTVPHLVCVYA